MKTDLVVQDKNTQLTTLRTQPEEYFRTIKIKNEESAINSGLLPLAAIRKEIGELKSMAILVLLINDLVKYFNVGMNMNDMQCADTARLIIQEYYFLNLADFKLCFDRIKSGKYGKSFNRIDGQIILIALAEYVKGRLEVAEAIAAEAHKKVKDTEQQEYYLVSVDGKYLRKVNDDTYEDADNRDHATSFDWKEAHTLKRMLPSAIIESDKKPDIGFMDWLRDNAPEMVRTTQRRSYQDRMRQLQEFKKDLDNSGMNEFDKTNELRKIIGMSPVSEEEFNDRKKQKTDHGFRNNNEAAE